MYLLEFALHKGVSTRLGLPVKAPETGDFANISSCSSEKETVIT